MPRIWTRFAIVTLALALASPAAWAEDGAPGDEPDHAGHPTEIVGIAHTRLLPTVLVVPHDSAFGWLNYSSGDATIKFYEDITPKLTCRSPGLFRASTGELASPTTNWATAASCWAPRRADRRRARARAPAPRPNL